MLGKSLLQCVVFCSSLQCVVLQSVEICRLMLQCSDALFCRDVMQRLCRAGRLSAETAVDVRAPVALLSLHVPHEAVLALVLYRRSVRALVVVTAGVRGGEVTLPGRALELPPRGHQQVLLYGRGGVPALARHLQQGLQGAGVLGPV